jgi:mono/diheme cytochrome c family protein
VTEVPEHLLQRSRERRAALGGGSAPAPAASSGGGDDGGGGASAPVPAAAAAATPAVVEPAAPPPPPPPYVQAALDRKKMPRWMTGVGAAALLWAFVYAGVLFQPAVSITDPVVAEGQEIFASQCAGCHGGAGQGGTGRPLAGQVLLTFPNIADHLAWVHEGSPAAAGTPYGDPNRPGGQHLSQTDGFGKMPAFGDALTDEQIMAVVRYEREVLDDADPAADTEASGGANSAENEAQTSGGDTNDSSSAGDDAGSGGGDTQGAEEDDSSSSDSPDSSGSGTGSDSSTSTTAKP